MKLLVKEIDKLKSLKHKGKIVSEYIIYVMVGDTPIEAHTQYGLEATNNKIIELITKTGITYDNTILN